MKVLTNVLQKLLWLLAALLLLLLAGWWWLRASSLPQVSGRIALDSPLLTADVTITRDRYGIPHIRADSDSDAIFALGFVHWQDRAWQMDFQRRVAQGRLSEILGESTIENDKFLRTWGFQKSAQAAWKNLSPKSKKVVAAYTAGINASMAQNKRALEFRILNYTPDPWTDVDSISWSKLMSFDLGGNYENELLALQIKRKLGRKYVSEYFPKYPKNALTVLNSQNINKENTLEETGSQYNKDGQEAIKIADTVISESDLADDDSAKVDLTQISNQQASLIVDALQKNIAAAKLLGLNKEEGKGSNNWVISGTRSLNGKPILANDPHLTLRSPMLWYLADVKGKDLSVIGATIPGLPSVVIGRNEKIAWGVTNLGADVQDLYILPNRVKLVGRSEVIKVKGQPDVIWQVRESEYGPIISDLGKEFRNAAPRVALRWAALTEEDTTMDAFVKLGYAKNWQEFRQSIELFTSPSQNFVYADTTGNIGYQSSGKIPVRSNWNGLIPLVRPNKYNWDQMIPFDKMPYALNPREGMLITANNKVTPAGFEYRLTEDSQWEPRYRAERIKSLLTAKQKGWTVSDMQSLQMDASSNIWSELKPYLMNTRAENEMSAQALYRLRNWNGKESLNSIEATLFEAWLEHMSKMGQDELNSEIYLSSAAIVNQIKNDGLLCKNAIKKYKNCVELLRGSLKDATSELSKLLGQNMKQWRYKKIHIATNPHHAFAKVDKLSWLFNNPVATAGGTHTLNASKNHAGKYTQKVGPSYRQIINMAQPNQSVFIGSLGQSGNLLSANSKDQQEMWVKGEYIVMSTDSKDWQNTKTLKLKKVKR